MEGLRRVSEGRMRTRREDYARGTMFRTAEGGKSDFVGRRPGMVARRGLW